MIFTTYRFFGFLIVVLSGYRLLNFLKFEPVAKLWLVLASFYFYAQGAKEFWPFFVGSVFFNYIIGTSLISTESKRSRKFLLIIGLGENLALLGYFKYANFFVNNYNILMKTHHDIGKIILPIGISFFTFQLIGYLVDCYRGKTKEYSVMDYLLFITFFPQLIVGPIVHHAEMVPQFESKQQSKFNKERFFLGLFIFAIGCGKKILLADPLTNYAQIFFADVASYGMLDTWLSSISYTISYYFDLSAYADMAIGMGYLFNVKIPENFDSPYKARNFRDYWRRWHMTLSRFLSDYVYRSIHKKGDSSLKFYFAVMVTFFVSGFWHGAGWNFIVWGLINGIFVCMAHFMQRRNWKLPGGLAWFLTFSGVVGVRIMFVANGLKDSFRVYGKLFDLSEFSGMDLSQVLFEIGKFASYNIHTILVLIMGMGIAFFAKNTREITENFTLNYKHAVVIGVLLAIALVQMSIVSDFLYFQF